MCFFIFLSAQRGIELADGLPAGIHLSNTDSDSVRAATAGGWSDAPVVMVTTGCSSCDLMAQRARQKHLQYGFPDYIRQLLDQAWSVHLLTHWGHGNLNSEQVTVKDKRRITVDQFEAIFPALDLDVRYVIVSAQPGSPSP